MTMFLKSEKKPSEKEQGKERKNPLAEITGNLGDISVKTHF